MDGGTFQVGLMVMDFIVSLRSGVCLLGAGSPITTLVVHVCAPLCITLSVKSGWLTTTWSGPRSRGYQRQRSMFEMISSVCRPPTGALSCLIVRASRLPVGG